MATRRARWAHLAPALAVAAACSSPAPSPGSADAAAADADPAGDAPAADAGPDAGTAKPIVILVIGDGMGRGQLEAARLYAGSDLVMDAMAHRGELRTASLSGITDSAAAATRMATGVATWNGRIGQDAGGAAVPTLVEVARDAGLATGVVTTSALPHATPGSFTAHRASRHQMVDIATDQATLVQPDVMLGGGARYFRPAGPDSAREDDGLLAPLAAGGYEIVTTRAELAAAAATGERLVGLFADEHMTYELDRAPDTDEPALAEMVAAALDVLDRDPDGFFLLVEGARIDMASHGNDLARTVAETLALDAAIAEILAWAEGRDEVTVVVTADHECGGLEVVRPRGQGALPDVTWRWGQHTNARVDVFAAGPGTARFDGAVRDHAWVHAAALARITGGGFSEPAPVLVPDGALGDLRHAAASQSVVTGFGAGYNQLDALRVDADARGLHVGVEGLFQWDENAVVVLVDGDYGAATGPAALRGALADTDGVADAILSASQLDAPPVAGFGADVAAVVWGGLDPHVEDLWDEAGLRRLDVAGDLPWLGAAVSFGEGVRAGEDPRAPVAGEGLEIAIPWQALYPQLGGAVPPGAELAMAVVLVNDDGGYTSNQALPPFVPGTPNPGREPVALPGVVVFAVDADGDGVADGDTAPSLAP